MAPQTEEWERNQPRCPQCHDVALRRHARVGFLQQVLLPLLGLYPWECGLCRKLFLLRQRSRGYTSSTRPDADADRAPDSATEDAQGPSTGRMEAVSAAAVPAAGAGPAENRRIAL